MGTATTFAELIAAPLSEKVFLCEVKPGEEVTGFTLTATKTYTYEIAYLNETITLADSSTETVRKAVVACEIDGTAATAKASIAEVEANPGSYWHDTANSKLYIHVVDTGPPYYWGVSNNTVIVYFWVYFATKGIVLDSRYYEPYIAENGVPSLSQASQQIHWGASQISSGEIVLINNRGFFDQVSKRWIWNNKDAKILLGGDTLAYSEYATIFAGKVMETSFTGYTFSLSIQSKAFDLLRSLPINNYWTDTWPYLEESAEGKSIPYFWGSYSAAQAPIVTCINAYSGMNSQCGTVYINGTIVTSGRVVVTVTAAGMGGSPKTLYVAVSAGMTMYQVADLILSALVADSDVYGFFSILTMYGFGESSEEACFFMQALTPAAYDATMNVSVLNDTCAGMTDAPTWDNAPRILQFKICDCTFHAIKSITQVYIDFGDGNGWQTIAHTDEDLNNGTFTISVPAFVLGTTRVKVAFEGYHSGGTLIEGAPEIVEDILLNQCGYASTDLNAASFTASKANSLMVLNVGVEKDTVAMTVIEQICQSDLAFFDEDGDGALRYRTWEPSATSATDVIAKEDIISSPQIKEDTSHLHYKVRVGYSFLHSKEEYLHAEKYNDESRYKYGRDDYLTINSYIREKSQAIALADKINWITRSPSPIVSLTLKAGLIDLTLGDLFKLTLDRAPYATAGGYDERVFEIIAKDISCFPLVVKLQGRDLMDFGNDVGFWMGAAAPTWAVATPAEREDSGFWCDASGYCDTSDSESRYKSLWW